MPIFSKLLPSDERMAKVGTYGAALCAAAATANILSGGEIEWAAAEIGVAVLGSLTAIRYTILQASQEIVGRSRVVSREQLTREFKSKSPGASLD